MKRQRSPSTLTSDSDFHRQEKQAKISRVSALSVDSNLPWFGILPELEDLLLKLVEPNYTHGYLAGMMLSLTCSKYYAHYAAFSKYKTMWNAYYEAIADGHLHVLYWFDNCFLSPRLQSARDVSFGAALRSGHIPVIEWAYQYIDRDEWSEPKSFNIFSANLAYNGGLVGLKWLVEHDFPAPTAYALDEAIVGGHNDIVLWLQERYHFTWFDRDVWACYLRYKERPHMAAMMASLKLLTPKHIQDLITWGIFTVVSGIVHYHNEFHDLVRRLVPEHQQHLIGWPGQDPPPPPSEMPDNDKAFRLFH
jgi:hypothetical protein